MEMSLGQLSRMLDTDHYVLVVHDQTQCKFLFSKYFVGIQCIDILNF